MAKKGKLTPMMQQYMQIKEENKDCILFYRLGDFYEMFFDDALTASKELEITLTGKNCGLEERAPMCGVPYHAVDSYLNKLVEKGYKVGIGEHYDESDDLTIFDPQATWKKSTLAGGTYTMRELLVPIFIKGQCVYKSPSVMDIRSYCKDELNTLWDESRRLVNPQEVYVDLSMPLYKLKNELLDANHKK